MSQHKLLFADVNATPGSKSTDRRQADLARIEGSGFACMPKNNGETIAFRSPDKPQVDFYPSTGRWRVVGGYNTMAGGADKFLKWYKDKGTKPCRLVVAPICPYCSSPAKLTNSAVVYGGHSHGMIWDCRPCDAYVGVHKDNLTYPPLGRLANAELRAWKSRAHKMFDGLWRSEEMTRSQAYRYIQTIMGLSASEAHIGLFDVAQCQKLIDALASRKQQRCGSTNQGADGLPRDDATAPVPRINAPMFSELP